MPFWSDPTIKPKQAFRWVISFGVDKNFSSLTSPANNSIIEFAAKSVNKPSYTIKTNSYKFLHTHTFKYPTTLEWQPVTIKFVDIWGFKNNYSAADRSVPSSTGGTTINIPQLTEDTALDGYINKVFESTAQTKSIVSNRSVQQFFYNLLADAGYYNPNEHNETDGLKRFRTTIFKKNSVAGLVGSNEDFAQDISDTSKKTYADQDSWKTLEIKELDELGNPIEKWKLFNPFVTKVNFGDLSYDNENLTEITVEISYDWAELFPFDSDMSDAEEEERVQQIQAQSYANRYNTTVYNNITASITASVNNNWQNKTFTSQDAAISINEFLIDKTAFSADLLEEKGKELFTDQNKNKISVLEYNKQIDRYLRRDEAIIKLKTNTAENKMLKTAQDNLLKTKGVGNGKLSEELKNFRLENGFNNGPLNTAADISVKARADSQLKLNELKKQADIKIKQDTQESIKRFEEEKKLLDKRS
jgi:hypothetical protein